uniref:Co-chaperonin GroES n=1 Tax=uncultured virus TaxID=340016 RepID=A0A221S495_9VIRU|nr:co-chaperonin GroES [uncultured virus]
MPRPVGKHLLVQRVVTKPDTGIILPDSVKSLEEDGVEFVVKAVGPQSETGVKEGDKLLFRPERIQMVQVHKDSDLYIVAETFVVGVK